ncbi:STAS domain-containing protein [Microbispora hainanensis]|uniref:STAS domain-containing protein n=2 Tax=Microbispora hainanensis TaxID=568844 RepID=A0A544Z525_9ACTN|nr:STAS domain-containing protein [Microbispora hainanensis]
MSGDGDARRWLPLYMEGGTDMTIVNGSLESALSKKTLLYLDKQLVVRSSEDGGVRLIGQIDLTNGDAMADALHRRWARPGTGTVDVAELQFIDLYGLRALALLSDAPLGRPIRLDNVKPSLRKLLTLLDWPAFTIG